MPPPTSARRYAHRMTPEQQQAMLATVAAFASWALGLIIGLLLLYLVIRQGVFHGLRAHTRWIDEGKG
jgi:hypothetical protein